MPKLLIYIPSYNRYELLSSQIANLVESIDKYKIEDVEVHVSDNCSEDERYLDLPNQFRQAYLKIHRNRVNIGLVGNLINGFQSDGWDYIWVLSDDDIISEKSVAVILENIRSAESNRNNFFYLICGIKGDSHFSDGDVVGSRVDYVSRFGTLSMMGLISANIYPAAIRDYVPHMYIYGHTLFPHVAGALKCMGAENFCLKCIGGNLIEWRPGNRSYDELVDLAYLNVVELANILDSRTERKAFIFNHIRQFGASHFFPFATRNFHQFIKSLGQVGFIPMTYCVLLFARLKALRAFNSFFGFFRR